MPSLLDQQPAQNNIQPADRLRAVMAAVRLSFVWFGTRKTLTPEQKAQAAEPFGADNQFLSARKKLIDTRHPAFQAVTAVRHRLVSYWRAVSLPYPDAGVRLIRQNDIAPFSVQMTTLQADLDEAVAALNEHYSELKSVARSRLGELFNAADYPASLTDLFQVSWDFPSVEPPSYLRQLSPELYRQESERVMARFEEAVRLAEEAFMDELSRIVSHLTERLSGTDDGKPKVFRDSAIENLTEFFDRFRHLNIRSNDQLDELVTRAHQVVRGVQPQQLRDDQPIRQRVATQLSGVQSVLDGLLVDRPRRNILRRPR